MTKQVLQEAKPKGLLGRIHTAIVAQIRLCPICKIPLSDGDNQFDYCHSCGLPNALSRIQQEHLHDLERDAIECDDHPGIWVTVGKKAYWVCHTCLKVFAPVSSYTVKFEVCEEGMFGGLYRSTKSRTYTKYRYVGRVDHY